jgi:hypothetical protein
MQARTKASIVIGLLAGFSVVAFESPQDSSWVGDSQNSLLFISVFAYGLAGGLAVLTCGWGGIAFRSRVDAGSELHAISSVKVVARSFLHDATAAIGTLATVMAYAILRTWLFDHRQTFWPMPLLLLPLVSVLACAAAGFTVGYLSQRRLFVLLAASAPYVSLLVAGQTTIPAVRLLPYIDEHWDPTRSVADLPVVVFEAGWLFAAAALVLSCGAHLAWAALKRTRRRLRVSGLIFVGLLSLVLISFPASQQAFSVAVPQSLSSCAQYQGNEVCWWAQRDRLGGSYRQALITVTSVTARLGLSALVFKEDGLLTGPKELGVSTDNAYPSTAELRARMLQSLVSAVGDPGCGGDAQRLFREAAVFDGLVRQLAYGQIQMDGVYPQARPELRSLLRASPNHVHKWAQALLAKRCLRSLAE